MLTENELWLLSFYRVSEINGAQFFAQLVRNIRQPEIQHNLTRHFSEEAQHAWIFTDCLKQLGHSPIKVAKTYQDYIADIGMPVNLMEILALTNVFERRVISHYSQQSRIQTQHSLVRETLQRIKLDEHWHLKWVNQALRKMEPVYGEQTIKDTIARYRSIDNAVYAKLLAEYQQRFTHLQAVSDMAYERIHNA